MLYNIAAIVAGFLLLVWGADRCICGAAATARNFKVSPLIIGLTVVGFGISATEMPVSAIAAADAGPGLAVGNALGSNIANITLVPGVSALIVPLNVHSRILRKELPKPMSTRLTLAWLVPGLAMLLISSKILVRGAVKIATGFVVSDLLIGLTIIAVGTSLPELAASVAGALKNEHDIAMGNVVGSNMFNTLAVMGIPGLIYPSMLDTGVLQRDAPVVFTLTIALVIMAYGFKGHCRINRIVRCDTTGLLCWLSGHT